MPAKKQPADKRVAGGTKLSTETCPAVLLSHCHRRVRSLRTLIGIRFLLKQKCLINGRLDGSVYLSEERSTLR